MLLIYLNQLLMKARSLLRYAVGSIWNCFKRASFTPETTMNWTLNKALRQRPLENCERRYCDGPDAARDSRLLRVNASFDESMSIIASWMGWCEGMRGWNDDGDDDDDDDDDDDITVWTWPCCYCAWETAPCPKNLIEGQPVASINM